MCKHFGETQVPHGVSLDATTGEVAVIIRPSGSGESALCRGMNRLDTVASGTVLIEASRYRPRAGS